MKQKKPVVAGNEISFDEIYDRYKASTMRRALRLLNGNTHDAEDAMQDAWSYIAKEADHLEFKTEAMLSSYIMITLEGRARAIRDKNNRRLTIPLPADEDGTESASCDDPVLYGLCAKETVESILHAVEAMKPVYREVLILSLLYDMPVARIAKTLKIHTTAAHMRLQRAKAALASYLRKEHPYD